MPNSNIFSLQGKVAIVTGGTGVLGGAMARGLAAAGAKIGVLGRRANIAAEVAETIRQQGGEAIPLSADVLDIDQLCAAREAVLAEWGRIDILINAAGGNVASAIVLGELTFFNLTQAGMQQAIDLNFTGTFLPTQVFGETMVAQEQGSIINISSMASAQALTRVIGYSAAKAAIDNLTRWLAVEFALKYGPGLRVNAIAPGFFIGEQNRDFLIKADGTPTARGKTIIGKTPMQRFGEPDELVGAAVWLSGDAARFVTGIVVPVDGGFSAFSGV